MTFSLVSLKLSMSGFKIRLVNTNYRLFCVGVVLDCKAVGRAIWKEIYFLPERLHDTAFHHFGQIPLNFQLV